jgi:carboxypeptidase Taq
MLPELEELRRRQAEVSALSDALAVLGWDQLTYLPLRGAGARGRQMAVLARLIHERSIDPAIGRLLDRLEPQLDLYKPDTDTASLIRVTRRLYERALRVPAEFVAEATEHFALIYAAWERARPANDFARVEPLLEKTLALSLRYADYFPESQHPLDAFIADNDYGLTTAEVRAVFAELRAGLVPLVEAIAQQPPADNACLHQVFAEARQWDFSLQVIKRLGYDLERGRLDKTAHPFMTILGEDDCRITTRVKVDDLGDCLFSCIHETGHAFYEMGVRPELHTTILRGGTSAAVHESQSRLWENLVGRSRAFWTYFYPRLQRKFGKQLRDVPFETFYRAINRVERSLLRTDADEVTYNLHVMIRFELEAEMLEGALAIRDLPEAWHARYQADLGLRAPDDRDGVLQDVHWYAGYIGGSFQGYTLGNIMSAQFFQAARTALPDLDKQIARGRFSALLKWLGKHLYQHGSKFTAAELLQRVTGGPLSVTPYLAYLRAKYAELYQLSLS